MDPHTYDHKKMMMMMNTSWGDGGDRSMLLENMASSMDDHHQHSHIFFHDHQQSHHPLPSSLDHQSPVIWTSCSTNDTNYVLPFSHSNHIVSSPLLPAAYNSSALLRFVGSSHHQVTLAHHLLSQEHREDDEQGDKADETCNNKDLHVDDANEEDVGLDDHAEEAGGEELSAMKEMMYKIAAMQPVDIDPSTIRKPKRRNVRISDDPQSMAARHRRERISEKMRILQRLVPGGTKMDTASMLDEAIRYVKFLKRQIKHLQQDQNPPLDDNDQLLPAAPFNHHEFLTAVTMEANKQKLNVRSSSVAATPSQYSNTTTATLTDHNHHNCCTNFNSALTHHHHHHHHEGEKPLEILNICTSSNNKVHQCMDMNNSIVMQTHLQMDIFSSQQVSGFMDRR